jgi:hypothetical protein
LPTDLPLRRLRAWAYRVAALLALAYVLYVVGLKLSRSVTGGPLGEVGEFLLALACVTAFGVGLLADEAVRRPRAPSPPSAPSASRH